MLTFRTIARYTLLPQIAPRIQSLVYTGFSYIAFFMAQVYGSVRLLPADHPYLHSSNMGRFGIRHVMAEAAHNLDFRRENIDQIAVFGLLLLGVILILAQICLLISAAFISAAHAGTLPTNFIEFFVTPNAQDDIAFVLMDRIFGLEDFWLDAAGNASCVAQGIDCFSSGRTPDGTVFTNYDRTATSVLPYPWPYHEALRMMFQWYSVGLLVVAVMIFLYFIVAIAAETAQSGTPFGRRFNHVWAPLRMVVALGLLIPISQGLNSAQWVLMHAAKYGSSFATNGWVLFNQEALSGGSTIMGNTDTLVAKPLAPTVSTLMEFATILATCKESYERMHYEVLRNDGTTRAPVIIDAYLIDGRSISGDAPQLLADVLDYQEALELFHYGDIRVVFGEYRENSPEEYQQYDGRVMPYCGEIRFPTQVVDETSSPGAYHIAEFFYAIALQTLWMDASNYGGGSLDGCTYTTGDVWQFGCIGHNVANRHLSIFHDPDADLPNAEVLAGILEAYQDTIIDIIDTGVELQQSSPDWLEDLSNLGWAGAAIWYNRVAELNGTIAGAANNLPVVQKYPMLLEEIKDARIANDGSLTSPDRFRMYQGPDMPIPLGNKTDQQIARAMFHAQQLWTDSYSDQEPTSNIFIDAINAVFGTSGLFNIHQNAEDGIHPLAQLVVIGKSIIESSIRNLGYSTVVGLGGGAANLLGAHNIGGALMSATGFFLQVAMIGLSIGFVLYYIIPFLPFIYFFFAVGSWVKSVFEAMVGVPLWALAHIRIDGNGLPGDAAMGGYYLLLEIFLRPILIIFGFLASIVIFGAQAQILHEIWPLVVSNAVGFDTSATPGTGDVTGSIRYMRGTVDTLFFTVIYAVIVYMLGMSSFKMIDQVPDHILRWMGASVSTFGDKDGDPAENLVRNSYTGSQMLSGSAQQVIGGGQQTIAEGGQLMNDIVTRSR